MLPMIKVNLKIITVALLSAFLNSCGGGIDVASNGSDGITGTGVTAGRVTSFGSIYVNGIKFDVDSATFSRDGAASSGQSEYSVGEYVVIKGSVDDSDPANPTGTAEEVIFEDILDGEVTEASADNLTIKVLGQSIEIDSNTTLLDDRDGSTSYTFPNLTDLIVGNMVEVSGVRDADGLIKATSIKLKEDSFVVGESENEIKGTVSSLNTSDETFMLGVILVDYSGASFDGFNKQDLVNGQYVEVESATELVGTTLVANEIELEDEHLLVDSGAELEIEGVVTRFNTILDFDVNGIKVTTNSETEYKEGIASDIGLNIAVEVKGTVNSDGVLVAKEIELED